MVSWFRVLSGVSCEVLSGGLGWAEQLEERGEGRRQSPITESSVASCVGCPAEMARVIL